MYAYISVCACIHMYICVCVSVGVYTHTHTHNEYLKLFCLPHNILNFARNNKQVQKLKTE